MVFSGMSDFSVFFSSASSSGMFDSFRSPFEPDFESDILHEEKALLKLLQKVDTIFDVTVYHCYIQFMNRAKKHSIFSFPVSYCI